MTDPIQGCCQLRTATSRLIEFVSPMVWAGGANSSQAARASLAPASQRDEQGGSYP